MWTLTNHTKQVTLIATPYSVLKHAFTLSPAHIFFPDTKCVKTRWATWRCMCMILEKPQKTGVGNRIHSKEKFIGAKYINSGCWSLCSLGDNLTRLKSQWEQELGGHYLLNCVSVHFSCHVNAIELLHGN